MSLHTVFASVAGQEDSSVAVVTEATVEQLVEAQVEAEVAEATAEVAEIEKDMDKIELSMDAIEDKVEELEEAIEGMESMLAGSVEFNAGLFAHQFAQATKIANRFGGEQVAVLGAESLADAGTAQLNAVAGIESFKEKLSAGASAVKGFFVELYNSFINFVTGIFNKYKALGNKATALKTKVEAKKEFEGEVKRPKAAGWVAADGKGPDVAALMSKVLSDADSVATGKWMKAADAVNSVKAIGQSSPAGSTENTATFKVQVGTGVVTCVVPKTEAGLGSADIAVGSASTDLTAIKSMSKESLLGLCNSVSAEIGKIQSQKLDGKALAAKRDKVIAELEKYQKENGAKNQSYISAARAGHKAILRIQRGVLKLGEQILGAKLALVSAHV
ncbi:internal head protein [Aeromonas phage D9]|nr:internal head protein [Aeromonas phage D9]